MCLVYQHLFSQDRSTQPTRLQGFRVGSGSVGMQIAFGVFDRVFLRVRRKTEPTGPGTKTVIFLKLTLMVRLGNRTYRSWGAELDEKTEN